MGRCAATGWQQRENEVGSVARWWGGKVRVVVAVRRRSERAGYMRRGTLLARCRCWDAVASNAGGNGTRVVVTPSNRQARQAFWENSVGGRQALGAA